MGSRRTGLLVLCVGLLFAVPGTALAESKHDSGEKLGCKRLHESAKTRESRTPTKPRCPKPPKAPKESKSDTTTPEAATPESKGDGVPATTDSATPTAATPTQPHEHKQKNERPAEAHPPLANSKHHA